MTYHWVKCCLMCFIAIVKPFFTHWFDYGLFRLPDQDYGLTAGVTGQQGMLTPPRHLIPPLVCPEVRDCPTLVFVFYLGLTRLITVRYLCLYIWIFYLILIEMADWQLHYMINVMTLTLQSSIRQKILSFPWKLVLNVKAKITNSDQSRKS